MKRARTLFLITVLAASAAAVGSLAWAGDRAGQRMAKGVSIEGVPVGGLTEQQSVQRVWSALRRQAMRRARVRVGDRRFTLSAREAGLRLRLPAAARQALGHGREGTVIERGWRQLTGGRIDRDVRLAPEADAAAVAKFVERIRRDVGRPPVDARLRVSVRSVTATSERAGRRLADAPGLRRRLLARLTRVRGRRELTARTVAIRPQVTRASLLDANATIVTVSRAGRRARLFRGGELEKVYRVAVGEPGSPTPMGTFRVQSKQVDPVWHAPESKWAGELAGKSIPAGDPRNPLIARWIGFNGAVGFHGTKSVDSLGRAASRGCVRMSRRGVIDLFRRVQVGTTVLVGR